MEIGVGVEATPDLEDLLQEPPGPAIPVKTEGAVLTQELPSKRVLYSTDTIGTEWVALLPGTPKRKSVVLLSADDFYVSESGMGGGALWLGGVPLVLTHSKPVAVKAVTGPSATIGSVVELWAD